MGVKPNQISRPSSLTIRHLFHTQLHKNKIPTSIWPPSKKPHKTPNPNNPNPNNHHHPIIISLTSSIHSPPLLSQLLSHLLISGLHHDPFLAGHFIKHLSSSLSPRLAVSLFSLLPNPDAFISNTIIKSFLSLSQPDNALSFYRDFVIPLSIPPNHFTFPLVTKIFSSLGPVRNGEMVHAQIVKLGFERDLYVGNSIVHMYSCFGNVGSAWKVFEECLEVSDSVTWNSMIDGLVKNGMVEAAKELFEEMPERDLFSWNVMIAGYAGSGQMVEARKLFDEMPERDVVTWNSMIDGYAKSGDVRLAREFFDVMPRKNSVSWNVMLALYARVKDYRECLKLFDAMVAVGKVKLNDAIFVSILTACGHAGDLERGKLIHSLITERVEEVKLDVLLSTALLTMYAKCGDMENAQKVFDGMTDRSVVTWNSMIMGYGLHGCGEKVMELFLEMERSGVCPNEKTFVCILSACAHKGLVVEGWWCFNRMVKYYGTEPKVEHIGCMVDLLGRAGLLKECEEIVTKVKGESSRALWGALMSASRDHGDWRLGEVVGKKMIEMEPSKIGPYVLLSNIYAAEGRWGEVEKVREMMSENGLKKGEGVSLVSGKEFEFECLEGEKSGNGKKGVVYSMLSEIGAHLKSSCSNL